MKKRVTLKLQVLFSLLKDVAIVCDASEVSGSAAEGNVVTVIYISWYEQALVFCPQTLCLMEVWILGYYEQYFW